MQQVVVSTKSAKSNKQYVWEADADSSSYMIREETDPEKIRPRGTEITLFLRVLIYFVCLVFAVACVSPFYFLLLLFS
jgi:hypothetical protein